MSVASYNPPEYISALPVAQYHYDIGYDGIFAHYRSLEVPKFKPEFVVDQLKIIRSVMNTEKKGIMIDDLRLLEEYTRALQKLNEVGIYMINFETKNMVDSEPFLSEPFSVDCVMPNTLC